MSDTMSKAERYRQACEAREAAERIIPRLTLGDVCYTVTARGGLHHNGGCISSVQTKLLSIFLRDTFEPPKDGVAEIIRGLWVEEMPTDSEMAKIVSRTPNSFVGNEFRAVIEIAKAAYRDGFHAAGRTPPPLPAEMPEVELTEEAMDGLNCYPIRTGIWEESAVRKLMQRAYCAGAKAVWGEQRKDTMTPQLTLQQLQIEQRAWSERNFGNQPAWMPLLGAVEELGELAHAHLKEAQGIRLHENHSENAKDAIADIVIYLADYCSKRGFDFGGIVQTVWTQVKQRDWKADPETAHLARKPEIGGGDASSR